MKCIEIQNSGSLIEKNNLCAIGICFKGTESIYIYANLYWKLKASFVQFCYYKAICRGYTYKHKIRIWSRHDLTDFAFEIFS